MEDKTSVKPEGDINALERERALKEVAEFAIAHGVTEETIGALEEKIREIRSTQAE